MARSSTFTIEEAPAPSSTSTSTMPVGTTAPDGHSSYLPHFHHFDHATAAPVQSSQAPQRPVAPQRQNSVQTRYMEMLLALDEIPRVHNILANFFTWILLAGFVIFPGTFTSLQSFENDSSIPGDATLSTIINSIKNLPLLVIAGVCCGIGAAGMLWLWWRWRQNYVWLLNKIFLPGVLNSLAGLINTLINVYTQQSGRWNITAEVTAIVTGTIMVITAILFLIYNMWVLQRVKRSHTREMETAMHGEEGLIEKVERKYHEPALEPGSVV